MISTHNFEGREFDSLSAENMVHEGVKCSFFIRFWPTSTDIMKPFHPVFEYAGEKSILLKLEYVHSHF